MQKRGRVSAHLRPPHTDTLLYRHKHTEKAFSPTKDVVLSRTFFFFSSKPVKQNSSDNHYLRRGLLPHQTTRDSLLLLLLLLQDKGEPTPHGDASQHKKTIDFSSFPLSLCWKTLAILLSNPAGSSGVVDHFFLSHK